jgi:hypothetical protein
MPPTIGHRETGFGVQEAGAASMRRGGHVIGAVAYGVIGHRRSGHGGREGAATKRRSELFTGGPAYEALALRPPPIGAGSGRIVAQTACRWQPVR